MYIREITKRLLDLGAKNVVLTGIGFEKGFTGVWFENREKADYYRHEQLPGGCHGTGDVYASAFAGALMRGKGIFEAASIAADYTVECIKNTQGDSSHWYGVKFEPVLPKLIDRLR